MREILSIMSGIGDDLFAAREEKEITPKVSVVSYSTGRCNVVCNHDNYEEFLQDYELLMRCPTCSETFKLALIHVYRWHAGSGSRGGSFVRFSSPIDALYSEFPVALPTKEEIREYANNKMLAAC